MDRLHERHRSQGATLAPDGIPLHYDDLKTEYDAALEHAVLMDRSHEGRIELRGRDRIDIIQRISTNDLLHLALNEGRATIFTNPNGRILDRALVYNRGDCALMLTEPGRGAALSAYLQRQIFFNDDVQITQIAAATCLFALHGPRADAVVAEFVSEAASLSDLHGADATIGHTSIYFARRTSLAGGHWAVLVPEDQAEAVWLGILEKGAAHGLIPAGSLTYNVLRIRAGQPGVGRELSTDYIPLEAGLWDEVSFSKGCYTGQEIIARMESRNRLAKMLVKLRLSRSVVAPAILYHEGKAVGTLTSSAATPDGDNLGLGFIKVPLAVSDQALQVGEERVEANITALAGVQPQQLTQS
jgi:aminomethyltransferase